MTIGKRLTLGKINEMAANIKTTVVPLSYFLFSVLDASPYQTIEMGRWRGRKKEKERVKKRSDQWLNPGTEIPDYSLPLPPKTFFKNTNE